MPFRAVTFSVSRFLFRFVSGVVMVAGLAMGASGDGAVDQEPRITSVSFQSGLKALQEGLPAVAVNHFNKALSAGPQKGKEWTAQEAVVIKQFLAEALVRAGKSLEALAFYASLPESSGNTYWKAIALIQQGRLTEGLRLLDGISGEEGRRDDVLEAKAYAGMLLGDKALERSSLEGLAGSGNVRTAARARIRLAQGLLDEDKAAEADQVLAPVLEEGVKAEIGDIYPYVKVVQARVLAAMGKWDEAKAIDAELIASAKVPVKMKDLARVSMALSEMKAGGSAGKGEVAVQADHDSEVPAAAVITGEDQLVSLIGIRPDSALLPSAFQALIDEKTFLTNPQAFEKLVSWTNQTDSNRQPLASYALADTYYKRNEPDLAFETVQKGLRTNPDHPVVRKMVLETVARLIRAGKYDEAAGLIESYPHEDAGVYFNSGLVAYGKKDYENAARFFDKSAAMAGERLARAAYYNANLNALAMGDERKQASLIKAVEEMPRLQQTLAYEQAHYAAQNFEPGAIEKLKQFIEEYPDSEDRVAAILDLAELALNISPPRLDLAREQIGALNGMKLTEEEEVRLACLDILLPESQQIWPAAITACQEALKRFPDSPKAPDMKLKLGELFFKNGNFNESLMILQSFSRDFPDSSLKEEALFLSGKAAQQCDTEDSLQKALNIFVDIADSTSRFSKAATIEVASIQQRMGQYRQAIETLDRFLTRKLSRQMRSLALSIQAEAYSSLTGPDEEKGALDKARGLCTQILETPNLMPWWRFSILSQRAQYAERAGDSDAALEDYYAILSYFPDVQSLNRKDWYWFYTAGFSAIHILENKQDWANAFAIAMRLSRTTGSRAAEARNIARRIQSEHFIWNDSGDAAFKELGDEFFNGQKEAEQPEVSPSPVSAKVGSDDLSF